LHSWCMCADDKGAMRSSGVSLASLWRPLYPLVVLVVCLVCIFLSKPLDSGDLESWYKAFRLSYYLLYNCCVVRLASLFYPKAYGHRWDFDWVILAEYFYANTNLVSRKSIEGYLFTLFRGLINWRSIK